MTAASSRPLLITHSGKFHCDEVFGYAVLRLALDLREPGMDHLLERTRDAARIEQGDIVWDVGSLYDHAACRYDHHQRGAPLRSDGMPFSSAGLLWQHYGDRAVKALLAEADTSFVPAIAREIDETIVRRIDETDNGVVDEAGRADEVMGLSALIGDCNPPWDSPEATGSGAGDTAFLEAAALAEAALRRRVDHLRARLLGEAEVLAAHRAADDPRILVLERGLPWKNVVFNHDLPVLFAVSPASNGNWMVNCMAPEPGSFAQRQPLPEEWAGLQGEELAARCGVSDAVFTHLRRFVAAARSRDGAVALARRALPAA